MRRDGRRGGVVVQIDIVRSSHLCGFEDRA